ncbi:ImmA/IrrE family metallo-endopeptidase [Microbacterium sp. MMO-10]|uniref:ImmA/IrrE family metallo-endopeptidase n=1 Tax=Microbacterium sp. MMO-10 TaxID=3081272 RepID=UPI0030174A3C
MLELIRFAASQGIEIHASHLDEDVFGYWSPDEGRIYYDLKLTPNEARVTVAHELGHAYYGDRCDGDRADRRAEKYAAALLIDPEEYARLEALDPEQNYLADELGVTVDLILFYEEHFLTRLGDVTYTRPRHGRAQMTLKRFVGNLRPEVSFG